MAASKTRWALLFLAMSLTPNGKYSTGIVLVRKARKVYSCPWANTKLAALPSNLFCKNAHNMATTLPFAKEECQDNTRNRTDSQHDYLAFRQLPRASNPIFFIHRSVVKSDSKSHAHSKQQALCRWVLQSSDIKWCIFATQLLNAIPTCVQRLSWATYAGIQGWDTDVAVKLKGSTTQTNWQKKPPNVKNVILGEGRQKVTSDRDPSLKSKYEKI